MKSKHLILILAALLLPAILLGCRASSPEPPEQLQTAGLFELFEPENAAGALQSRLANSLALEDVQVAFDEKQGKVRVQFEHPHGMSTHQLTILYLAVLIAAENYLPYSEQVEMVMALEGKPFLGLEVKVEALRDFRDGKIERDEFFQEFEITVPGTT